MPEDDHLLPDFGLGLTDLAKTASGTDAKIPAQAYDPEGLMQKINQYRPRALAFTSLTAARLALGRDARPGRLADDPRLDAAGNLVIPPFVEPHIHLDATLTAGEPRWNMSGTLFEGIERWAERKELNTHEDTKTRASKTIGMLVDHGIQHVRTHVDVTDPKLTALKAMMKAYPEPSKQFRFRLEAIMSAGAHAN